MPLLQDNRIFVVGICFASLVLACADHAVIQGDSATTTQSSVTASSSADASSSGATGGSGGQASSVGGAGGASACDASNCTQPGHVCVGDMCVADCRLPGANPCAPATVCNVGSDQAGLCVPADSACAVSNPEEACGSIGCGPGTRCDLDSMMCVARLPCTSTQCQGQQCWGTNCPCQRPAAKCSPAPLGQPGDKNSLNDPAFSRCGTLGSCNGGLVDLDFDQDCNAFGVTTISGQDFLRRIDAAGKVSEWGGVTNLNMGEVAAIQGKGGVFGGNDLSDVVALTYTCCATCGCILSGPSGDPQGVAMLDAQTSMLPMVIPSTTFTSASGPWGNKVLDTGPYGLSWGLDRVLYVGNSEQNGQFHALDLMQQSKVLVHTFGKRVLATTPFDSGRMLVALAGGEVFLTPILGSNQAPQLLVTLDKSATSLVRDAWRGDVYAELKDGSIVRFGYDGSDQELFATAPKPGRIAIAPDGYLYHLSMGYPSPGAAAILRWPLPTTL